MQATDRLPELQLSHLSAMTDDAGVLQHAIFSVPNCPEGYAVDDNARALIAATLLSISAVLGDGFLHVGEIGIPADMICERPSWLKNGTKRTVDPQCWPLT